MDPPSGNPWMSFAPPPVPTADQMAALPSSGVKQPRQDRAPAWVLALSGLVIAAMVVGAAYLVTDGGPSYPKSWDDRVAPIADWVARERKLDFEHPVKVDFLTPAEYKAAANAGGNDSAKADREAEDAVAELRALGLVNGDVDLGEATDTLTDTGTLAYYDQGSKRIFVRGTTMTPGLRVTLAHELTHVLQDQHYDLTRLSRLPDEQSSVLRAIAEGDAERIEDVYVDDVLSDREREQYEKSLDDSSATEEIDAKVPESLTAFFAAPYVFGPRLVEYLEHDGGSDRINKALEDPPTEEVMFDPRLLDSDEAKVEKVEAAAPSGAETIRDGYFGPTAWYLVLASRLDPKVALKAVDGLAGDHYVTYREDNRVCVRVRVVGDSAAQLTEFEAALKSWVAKSPEGATSVGASSGTVDFRSCDPGKDAPAVGKVTVQLFALPITRNDVYLGATKGGFDPDQASCYAQGIVDRFSIAELNDPDAGNKPEFTAAIAEIRSRCE